MTNTQYLQRLYEDFVFFVEELWKARGLDKLAPIGPVERDILRYIANGPNRRGVLAPRGIGKTTFGTVAYTLWRLFRDANAKIVVVSKSRAKALEFVKLVRNWITHVPFLQHLQPRTKTRQRAWRDNVDMFDTGASDPSKDPSVRAIGVDGHIEGSRAHVVIGDDVETDNNTRTLEARTDLDLRVREFTSVSTFGAREIVFFGTFHHEESVYLKLAERQYAFRTWPLLYPEPGDRVLNLAPELSRALSAGTANPGDIVFAHRIDQDYVDERMAEGRTYFAMQQMLLTDLGDTLRYPLHLKDVIIHPIDRTKAPISISWGMTNQYGNTTRMTTIASLGFGNDSYHGPIHFDEQWAAYTGTKMWVDPSGKGKDKTGYAVVAHLNGYLWVKAVSGLPGGYDQDTLQSLAEAAKRHGVDSIYVEDNFGVGMFQPLFEPVLARLFVRPGSDEHLPEGWSAPVETVRVRGQKEMRIIESLEPLFNTHRLVFDPSVAENEDLQYQITRLTRQRGCLSHEDELDALASCCAQWQDVLHDDPRSAAQRSRAQATEQQLDDLRAELGLEVAGPSWIKHM